MLQLSSQESAEMFDLALVLGCRLKYPVALGAELDRRFTHDFLVLPCEFQKRMLSIIDRKTSETLLDKNLHLENHPKILSNDFL